MHVAKTIFFCMALALGIAGCGKKEGTNAAHNTPQLRKVHIVIDWQPVAEYYGFFYAKGKGLYAAAGYDLEISYGKGAPSVAAELAAGSIALGTTTSDNIARWMARGSKFSAIRALSTYNPAVVISLEGSNIADLAALKGKRLGTNPESAVYTQFLKAVKVPNIRAAGITEDPSIGWSGIAQLQSKEVDAILGYTTNVAVDLTLAGSRPHEIYLGDHGIQSYGLVIAAAGPETLSSAGLTSADLTKIFDITSKGYADGATAANLDFSIDELKRADPALNPEKLRAAILKFADLNARIRYPLGAVDAWLEADGIPAEVREAALKLYK